MQEYWESRFSNEGAMWKYEPSDAAIKALSIFKENDIKKILIPGFGYGRNAQLFYHQGFEITGIEISASAIELAHNEGLNCKIIHGSVIDMPFDDDIYEGIFCHALLHLLNQRERHKFLTSCYHQLRVGGYMIFSVVSDISNMYGRGKKISMNRYEITPGLTVFFYNLITVEKEFKNFGLLDFYDMEEPIKHMENQESLKCIYIVCKKL